MGACRRSTRAAIVTAFASLPRRRAIHARGNPTDLTFNERHVLRLSRTITYTESKDRKSFFINGREFDINRIDVDVKLGDVEEWTIVNDTDERHTFHIHQLDFLVQSVGDNPLETTGMRVDVPFRDPKTRVPGMVKVKVPFTNPLIVGKFPFHCHILEHEDGGMMANVRVRAR